MVSIAPLSGLSDPRWSSVTDPAAVAAAYAAAGQGTQTARPVERSDRSPTNPDPGTTAQKGAAVPPPTSPPAPAQPVNPPSLFQQIGGFFAQLFSQQSSVLPQQSSLANQGFSVAAQSQRASRAYQTIDRLTRPLIDGPDIQIPGFQGVLSSGHILDLSI